MDSPFLKMARDASNPSFVTNMKFAVANISPTLFKLLKINLFRQFEGFFITAMKRVLTKRKESLVKTHDFADLCIEVQQNGTMKDPAYPMR